MTSIADPKATSIQALCHRGKPSGWILVRGSSLSGLSARIRISSAPATILATHVLRLNYSSFDLAAFVYNVLNESEVIGISFSSDEFINQSLPIGVVGTFVSAC
jgi:hypothetical protein